MRTFFFFSTLLLSIAVYGQSLTGQITDTQKQPIPFATIYSEQTMEGTLANSNGIFTLNLSPGTHTICIKHMGHKTQLVPVNLEQDTLQLDVSLQPQVFTIPEARILASGEDPAYGIMRKAIALSAYYLKQVSEYKCQVYLKGTGVIKEIPRLLERRLKKEGIEEGKHFVTEHLSNIHFSLPNNIEQEVLSIRSSGQESDAQPMDFITLSLYHDIQGIASPLGSDAMAIYTFRHDGSFYDQDYLVHKIHVKPKSKGAMGYRGHIYITEGFWHLHSAQLKLERNMFTININQLYAPHKGHIWMPISHNFKVIGKTMGFKVHYNYVASVKDYELTWNKNINHAHFAKLVEQYFDEQAIADSLINQQVQDSATYALIKKESINKKEGRKLKRQIKNQTKSKPSLEIKDNYTIKDSAEKRTSEYWQEVRPVPLTQSEKISFKDTLLADSIDSDTSRAQHIDKFRWNTPLSGYSSHTENTHFHIPGIINPMGWSYNTVDGPVYRHKLNLTHNNDKKQRWQINGMVGYAFSRKDLLANAGITWHLDRIKRTSLHLEAGTESTPFHQHLEFNAFSNMLSTLFYKENLTKYYEHNHLSAHYKTDIVNGLVAKFQGTFAYNKQLYNNADFYLTNPWDNAFTPNIPERSNLPEMVSHHNVELGFRLSYTPRHYYRIRNGYKQMLYSNWPTFTLGYKQGITRAEENKMYSCLMSQIDYKLRDNYWGTFQWKVKGTWAPQSPSQFTNYQHITTQPFFFTTKSVNPVFKGLPLYKYSGHKYTAQFHMRWYKSNLLITRLPWLNKSFATEHIAFRIAKTDRLPQPWTEVAYGINNLFLLINAEAFSAFKGKKHQLSGLRIVLPITGDNSSIVIGE
ncbi:MAG: DUF5686 and carboxypeptidase regulatory-like domain-containing protein [Bacteroidota bacterium]